MMSSELAIWANIRNYDSGETQHCPRSSGNTKGSILRSLPVFLAVPPRKSRVFRQKNTVLRGLKKIPVTVGLKRFQHIWAGDFISDRTRGAQTGEFRAVYSTGDGSGPSPSLGPPLWGGGAAILAIGELSTFSCHAVLPVRPNFY